MLGRLLLYALIAFLGLFVLAAAVLFESGGGASEAVAKVTVHDLSTAPQTYDSERVTTEGILRRLTDPDEHFLVTAEGLAVVVRGYDVDELRALDGRQVAVTGRFGFDAESGVYIEADEVTPLQ